VDQSLADSVSWAQIILKLNFTIKLIKIRVCLNCKPHCCESKVKAVNQPETLLSAFENIANIRSLNRSQNLKGRSRVIQFLKENEILRQFWKQKQFKEQDKLFLSQFFNLKNQTPNKLLHSTVLGAFLEKIIFHPKSSLETHSINLLSSVRISLNSHAHFFVRQRVNTLKIAKWRDIWFVRHFPFLLKN